MNLLHIIGNVTKDPETRTTPQGIQVCNFTVAVNRRKVEGKEQEAYFFRVTAWRGLADVCGKYLAKGRKVSVTGEVRASAYKDKNGESKAQLEVTAQDVEFLGGKADSSAADQKEQAYTQQERTAIQNENNLIPVETEDLPF